MGLDMKKEDEGTTMEEIPVNIAGTDGPWYGERIAAHISELPPAQAPIRVTESYNANDAFICPNGHIQYNLTPEALADCKARSVIPPPVAYEGARCHDCDESVTALTADPQVLQLRLSRAMKHIAKLTANMKPLVEINTDMNQIALFLRNNYSFEIMSGEPQHSWTASKAVIYYLQRERRRPVVVVGKVARALLRFFGVQ
jgi:hypothetical protein